MILRTIKMLKKIQKHLNYINKKSLYKSVDLMNMYNYYINYYVKNACCDLNNNQKERLFNAYRDFDKNRDIKGCIDLYVVVQHIITELVWDYNESNVSNW